MGSTLSVCRRSKVAPAPCTKDLITDSEDKTRDTMKAYWDGHSQKKVTDSLMLLMKDDASFANKEKAEIMSYLPCFEGLSVVELGSGCGRFTGDLAQKASAVLAVDFVDKFLKENKRRFQDDYPHIDFLCRDVTKLDLDDGAYDFVFSNWLMMYLDDAEIEKLAEKFYRWCSAGGYIFFRESCEGGASGDIERTSNPTFYRKYQTYIRLFDAKEDLQRIAVNQVQVYMDKNKTNQYCFLYKKLARQDEKESRSN